MALSKYRLGDLIKVVDERNSFGIKKFMGLNINKEFMPTNANTEGLDETKYKVVRNKRFVFSGMQTGRDQCIRISMYQNDDFAIVSPAYTTFEVSRIDLIIPDYFFMIFLSKEKDRYGAFCSDGSIRTNLDWDVFCNIIIDLPNLETQEKFVNVYKSMIKNQEQYERGLDDLKLTCDAYIKSIDKYHYKNLGEYISRNIDRNEKEIFSVENVKGFNNDGEFIEPMRLFSGNIKSFKILHNNMFVYNSRINSTITKLSIALNDGSDLLISPAYESFYISNNDLMPKFLLILLQQESFAKKVLFNSFGSSTIVFTFENLCEMKFPIPSVEVQNSIVNIHDAYKLRKKINEKLKEQIKNICPILIKGAIEEAREV